MAAAPHTPVDGNIHAGLRDFGDAVNALLDPVTRVTASGTQVAPSLYVQLCIATKGTQSQSGTGGGGKPQSPMWTEAFDLLNKIDIAVGAWHPGHCCEPATICRLRSFTTGWRLRGRPQDTAKLKEITGSLTSWATSIDALFDPHHQQHLRTACPQCGEKTTYGPDAAGEIVRRPALQIDAITGCTCRVCGHFWAPTQFKELATQVIAHKAAAKTGVLE